ncbi:hypothetical protein ALC57_06741 [Trachymyrmex cornetzi]|uniref:Uncharacterized protein n=1 Tax=Trachymyrmex cornetzi TaxID=471704 RepID=A0A195E6L4_9HYME|nr:hypothetical protein ALC57_06741 [Trachymyrmex cornetzi]
MTLLCVLIAGGSTRECERYPGLVLIHLSIHYLAIYIYSIYRHAPAVADDKSDIATRDNFGALLPEKSNHIAWRKEKNYAEKKKRKKVNLCKKITRKFSSHRWSGKTVQPPAAGRTNGGTRSVLSSQPVHLESCRRPAAAGDT